MLPHEREFADLYGPHFTFAEFACKCHQHNDGPFCDPTEGSWFRSPEFAAFMSFMTDMRESLNFPFVINSGHRCPMYNDLISSTGKDGPHTIAAADVKASFERAYALVELAYGYGLGVGQKQHGPVSGRFIHLDNLGRRLWTYP